MFSKLTKGAKIGLIALLLVILYFGVTSHAGKQAFGRFLPESKSAVTVDNLDLPVDEGTTSTQKDVPALAAPSKEVANSDAPYVKWNQWEWNSQIGTHFANGGPKTTKGSLMEAQHVNLQINRADDHYKSTIPEMVICAQALDKGDLHTTKGVQFVSIMGDGAAVFIDALNKALETVDPKYKAEILFSPGKSYGEDQIMGLPEWKADPQKALGSVFSAVIKDGDWNILMKWADDNNLKVNLNEGEWHDDAINVVNAPDYLDAAKKYNSGYTSEFDEVIGGVKSGRKVSKPVNGVATWTPGDVNVAEGKGGLVTLASTKDYGVQMANVTIGINVWDTNNADIVKGIIAASLAGSDQIKFNPKALDAAADISAKIYDDQDGKYWAKYYKGVTKNDVKDVEVSLGGSKVLNLQDNLDYYGLAQGKTNVYKSVYNVFGNLVAKLYPKDFPKVPDYESVVNLSYLQDVAKGTKFIAPAEHKVFTNTDAIRDDERVGSKNYSIEFETGSAQFTPAAKATLLKIVDDLLVSSELRFEIQGHTDNAGNFQKNKDLSLKRAEAVRDYLESVAPDNFNSKRVSVKAFGSLVPVAPNTTEAGRAKNRRVTIVQAR